MLVAVDHLLWGVPELAEGCGEIASRLGVSPSPGGRHEGLGTHNALLDLGEARYLEVIAPDPGQDGFAHFGRFVDGLKAPRLLTWAARSDDLAATARAARDLGLATGEIVRMSRRLAAGGEVHWRLLELGGHAHGPLLPFFIEWGDGVVHPSRTAASGCRLERLRLGTTEVASLAGVLAGLGFGVGHGAAEILVEAAAVARIEAELTTPLGEVALRAGASAPRAWR